MESEFLQEMFGLSVDHYVAVVAVEVGCHVVHTAIKALRSKRTRAPEAPEQEESANVGDGPPSPDVHSPPVGAWHPWTAGQKKIRATSTGWPFAFVA